MSRSRTLRYARDTAKLAAIGLTLSLLASLISFGVQLGKSQNDLRGEVLSARSGDHWLLVVRGFGTTRVVAGLDDLTGEAVREYQRHGMMELLFRMAPPFGNRSGLPRPAPKVERDRYSARAASVSQEEVLLHLSVPPQVSPAGVSEAETVAPPWFRDQLGYDPSDGEIWNIQCVDACGFPWRCFQGTALGATLTSQPPNYVCKWEWCIPLYSRSGWLADWAQNQYKWQAGVLPLQPIMLGLFGNVVVYSVAAGCFKWSLRRMIRALRSWKRTCANCGYPVGKAEVCPECGVKIHLDRRLRSGHLFPR